MNAINSLNDSVSHGELFALASQLYVRVRRSTGRIVDAVYMVQNEAYAREILKLANSVPDVELLSLVTRYENLLNLASHATGTHSRVSDMELPAFDQTLPLAPAPRSLRTPTPPPAAAPIPVVMPVVSKPATVTPAETAHSAEEDVAAHYIGALR